MPASPLDLLLDHARTTFLLSSAASLLAWDQETMMPAGGGELRSRQLSLLASLAHQSATDPRLAEWLASAAHDPAVQQDPDLQAQVRELHRDHERATRLPNTLVAELAAVESRAQQEWASARQADDFARFRPWLERMVALQRQKAACLQRPGQEPWDALADLHEPGMNRRDLEALFTPLQQRLLALLDRLRGGKAPPDSFDRRCFPQPQQEAFVRAVLAAMGFDDRHGRLDRSAHPFCTGTGPDVRLTTRFHQDRVLDALSSTMHEGGHGLYEQGLPAAHLGTPLAEAVSLGIHESQSRLWENQVGRSRGFWRWCHGLAVRHLGSEVAATTPDQLFAEANRVQPSLIRVEADECTYNLHVLVRFQLEPRLLSGDLPVADLPAAWNERYRAVLGVEVPDFARGCLQDVHWSCGLFGYFPTYTLGNLYAAQLFAAASAQLPDLDAAFARGEFTPLREWLRKHVHRHGRRHPPAELCRLATGAPLSSAAFLSYLEQKLAAVYEL